MSTSSCQECSTFGCIRQFVKHGVWVFFYSTYVKSQAPMHAIENKSSNKRLCHWRVGKLSTFASKGFHSKQDYTQFKSIHWRFFRYQQLSVLSSEKKWHCNSFYRPYTNTCNKSCEPSIFLLCVYLMSKIHRLSQVCLITWGRNNAKSIPRLEAKAVLFFCCNFTDIEVAHRPWM